MRFSEPREDAFTDALWGSFDIHPQACAYGTGIAFYYEDSRDDDHPYGTAVFPLPETWAFVAVTRSIAGELTIYNNGDVIGHWNDSAAPAPDVTRELTIGARYYSPTGSGPYEVVGFFPGLIDDVAIFDRPLSAEEISELASHGTPPGPVVVPLPASVLLGAFAVLWASLSLRRGYLCNRYSEAT